MLFKHGLIDLLQWDIITSSLIEYVEVYFMATFAEIGELSLRSVVGSLLMLF